MQDIAAELLPGERDLERHATLRPGEFWALDGVSFELRRLDADQRAALFRLSCEVRL